MSASVQFCILWHFVFVGIEMRTDLSSPKIPVSFPNFSSILSIEFSQIIFFRNLVQFNWNNSTSCLSGCFKAHLTLHFTDVRPQRVINNGYLGSEDFHFIVLCVFLLTSFLISSLLLGPCCLCLLIVPTSSGVSDGAVCLWTVGDPGSILSQKISLRRNKEPTPALSPWKNPHVMEEPDSSAVHGSRESDTTEPLHLTWNVMLLTPGLWKHLR